MDATDTDSAGYDLSQITLDAAWADWPNPSPTSMYRINVRFYGVSEDDDTTGGGALLRLDLGPQTELMLESLYAQLQLAERGFTPVQFEEHIRLIYQTRFAGLLQYGLQQALYPVLTGDVHEVQHACRTEGRLMLRSARMMPHKLYPGLVEAPETWRERLRARWDYLVDWVRVRLPFIV